MTCLASFSKDFKNWKTSMVKIKSLITLKLRYFYCICHSLFHVEKNVVKTLFWIFYWHHQIGIWFWIWKLMVKYATARYNFMINVPVELVLLSSSWGALMSSTYELTIAVAMIISFTTAKPRAVFCFTTMWCKTPNFVLKWKEWLRCGCRATIKR